MGSLTTIFPVKIVKGERTELLGALVGSNTFTHGYLRSKLGTCECGLKLIEKVAGAKAQFHIHWFYGSACEVLKRFPP